LCKFESLYNRYSRSNIHDTTNAFKDMEPKFWCLRHTRFHIKDMMICEMNCMWQLHDESLVVALSHGTLYTCKEIDGDISSATSPTREVTLIKICSKLLDANLSRGRISPLDSLHLCQNDEQLGRWS
jgi:hypothetical protein